MPVNSELTYKTWSRYAWCRDNGHTRFMTKADKCERFFQGDQWDAADRAALESQRRPVLTINKILSTVGNVMGEQINNRSEISFRPRSGAPTEIADILNKVYKQISDNNQLDWVRSDVFADGIIKGRGFADVRIEYGDSMQGDVAITKLNAKNVIIDPDGEAYDPDTWGEVFTTKWLTADDIAVTYTAEDAELLRNKDRSAFPYGYDAIQMNRDRFGYSQYPMYSGDMDNSNVLRNIRVIERQYRMLDKQKHFLAPETGDMRPIPKEFDRNRIALFVEKFGFQIVPKLVRRIKWTVMADNVLLHDDWSPYKHFTVVPYFPHFRDGKTIGLVENLVGPQELLNKVTSQELHVVNTTANSGYKVRAGALTNMTVEELEQKGAQTGLVIEVNGDPDKDVQKISPNQVPQGLDRISYKAEESIKTISGISDSMQGMDRADVAAKAIQAKQKAGSTNLVKPLDNLARHDFFMARAILDLVQEFYTETRLMTITHDRATGESETFEVNGEDAYGEITNDLTLGEYDIVVSSVPVRETLEDSQFEQAMALRESGIQIPDSVLIDSSRLMNKKDIIKQMQQATQSPEAIAAQELQVRGQQAEVAKTEAEAQVKGADAQLKVAKTGETQAKTQEIANGPADDGKGQAAMAKVHVDAATQDHKSGLEAQRMEHEMSIEERKLLLEREKMQGDQALKAQDMEQKRIDARLKATQDAATAAAKPPASRGQANRSRLPTSR
jgi:hypothetical protein